MTASEHFEAWSQSANALWRSRERLRTIGIDPETDDAYVTAWVNHAEAFSPPPEYPGRVTNDSQAAALAA